MEICKLGKGRCILINDRPYRIIDTKSVVISKHSHTKTKVDLEDVFSGEKTMKSMSPHDNVKEIDIPRKRGQLISKLESAVQVMDMVSYNIFDAQIAKELLDDIAEGDMVTFVEYNGAARVIDKRVN